MKVKHILLLMFAIFSNAYAQTDSLKNYVQGTLVDETNEGIIGGIVAIKNIHCGAMTDYDGNFKFYIPDSLLSDTLMLRANYIEYKLIEMKIGRNDLPLTKRIMLVEKVPLKEIKIVWDKM